MEDINPTIKNLLKVIVQQEKEIAELKAKVKRIKDYIEVYEEFLKGRN